MPGKFTLLGDKINLVVLGDLRITREPWPFFDVKGSGIEFNGIVSISSGVHILTHGHRFNKKNWRELGETKHKDPTIICENVFIGINALIMPTCKYIGMNSVIGAGSVVTRDVPDNEIWAGNPAKKIGAVE